MAQDLEAAYGLDTPDDNIALYRDWARPYDAAFAEEMDYVLPMHVAEAYRWPLENVHVWVDYTSIPQVAAVPRTDTRPGREPNPQAVPEPSPKAVPEPNP